MAIVTPISSSTDLSSLSGTKISSSTTTTTTDSSKSKADELKNQFLSILLTQMQHQNPLDPMDTKEFTGQLTQFSSLEQQIDTNSKLDSLLGSLTQSSLSAAFGYIGQYVDLENTTSTMQAGAANWTYALPSDAAKVNVKITDESGKTLYSGEIQNSSGGSSVSAGSYAFSINNDDLSEAQADGAVLKFTMTATDKTGKTITPSVHTTVKVESVQSDSEGTYLQAGGILFAIGDVKKIVTAPTTTTATETTTDTTTA
jgi:flagellar basal-body rod modification protein FlgD